MKLQIISGKFQNNAINNVKQISLIHVITIIITYQLLIIIMITITKSHNNYCSVGVLEMFIKFVDID